MPTSLAEIRSLEVTRGALPSKLIYDHPPAVPGGLVITGHQGLLRAQWATVPGVDGYDIAIMTTPNVAAPDVNIERIMGGKNREHTYSTGNVAITRYFAVRAFAGDGYSDWSKVVSGLSVVFGAPESAPPLPPSTPPSGYEPPPTGKTFGGAGSLK